MKNNFSVSRIILSAYVFGILEFALGSQFAIADRAEEEVRLDIGTGPLAHVKTRDQGFGFGDCYANVAAGLVDAYRFSHGDKAYNFQSSALVLATEYSLEKGRDNTVGGDACAAFNAAARHGVCNDATLTLKNGDPPEKYIPSFLEQQKKVAAIFTFRQELDSLKEKYNSSLVLKNKVPQLPPAVPLPSRFWTKHFRKAR